MAKKELPARRQVIELPNPETEWPFSGVAFALDTGIPMERFGQDGEGRFWVDLEEGQEDVVLSRGKHEWKADELESVPAKALLRAQAERLGLR